MAMTMGNVGLDLRKDVKIVNYPPTENQRGRQGTRPDPYDIWRDFDPADTVRFYSLRLKEAGIIKSSPEEILKLGTDFRYFKQLRKELQTA